MDRREWVFFFFFCTTFNSKQLYNQLLIKCNVIEISFGKLLLEKIVQMSHPYARQILFKDKMEC